MLFLNQKIAKKRGVREKAKGGYNNSFHLNFRAKHISQRRFEQKSNILWIIRIRCARAKKRKAIRFPEGTC